MVLTLPVPGQGMTAAGYSESNSLLNPLEVLTFHFDRITAFPNKKHKTTTSYVYREFHLMICFTK